jgi:hypothetical protein
MHSTPPSCRVRPQASSWHEGAARGVRSDVDGFEPHPLDYYVLTADLAVGG